MMSYELIPLVYCLNSSMCRKVQELEGKYRYIAHAKNSSLKECPYGHA